MNILLFFVVLLVSKILFAAIPINGLYASVLAGYTYIPPNVSTSQLNITYLHPSYNNGWNGGGRIGYQSLPLRYEGDISYVNGNLFKFKVNNIVQNSVSGLTTGTFVMGNVYYDFPEIVPCVMPFLGVGLGYGYLTVRLNSQGPLVSGGPGIAIRYRATDNAFAYQVTSGFTYNFSENYAINFTYRYIGTDRAKRFGKSYEANLISVGAVYRFEKPNLVFVN